MTTSDHEPLVATGNVRHSDPVIPLERLVDETLTVGDIVSTPIWFIPPTMSVVDALGAMEAHQFDLGGVGPEPVASFVEKKALEDAAKTQAAATVQEFAQPIPASSCIERALPISSLFDLLLKNERLFVLKGDQVQWLVTRSDLGAPAVGAAVLGFFTIFEAGLKELARNLSDERLKEILRGKDPRVPDDQVNTESRLGKALRVHKDLMRKNLHTEFRDCLSLPDWLTVLKKEPALAGLLGFHSLQQVKEAWGSFPRMRNDVAHVRGLLHTSTVAEALEKITSVRDAGRNVWSVIRHQAPIWDRYSQTIITLAGRRPKLLTGPEAVSGFPFRGPVHLLSGWNPGSVWRSDDENRRANETLRSALLRQGADPIPAHAASPDGKWFEDSFVVEKLSDGTVAELAKAFGQMSIFKISAENLAVLDVRSLKTVREVPRRFPIRPTE